MPWPDFVVVGAAKAGTTALDAALRQHPSLFLPTRREPNFFAFPGGPVPYRDLQGRPAPMARTSVTDPLAYGDLFADAAGRVTGEVSPAYLYVPAAAEHLAERVPDVRVVAILRDPAERAFSAYQHLVREGREPLPFGAALDAEPARIARDVGLLWRYVDVGRYAAQVRRFVDRVGPRRLHLIRYDDLVADPTATHRRLFTFLGVDPDVGVDTSTRWNASGVPRSGALQRLVNPPAGVRRGLIRAVPAPLRERARRLHARATAANLRRARLGAIERARLVGALADDVAALEDLTGWRLDAWRR